MRKIYPFLLCLLLISSCGTSDISPEIIEYNARTGEFKKSTEIPLGYKSGTPLILKITGINTDSVTIPEATVRDLETNFEDIPAVLNTQATSKKEDTEEETETSEITKSIVTTDTSQALVTSDSLQLLLELYHNFNSNYRNLQSTLNLRHSLLKLIDEPFVDKQQVQSNLKSILESQQIRVDSPYHPYDKIVGKIDSYLTSMEKSYSHILLLEKVLQDQKSNSADPEYELEIKDSKGKKIGSGKVKIATGKKKEFETELKDLAAKYKKTLTDSAYVAIKKRAAEIAWLATEISQDSFSYTTNPIIIDGEGKEITYLIKNKKGETLREIPFTFKATGITPSIDFSTGYLLSFSGNETFATYTDNSGTVVGVRRSNENDITHALGGLMHIYPREVLGVQFGGSAGISLSTEGEIGFYGGPSIFFLSNNRLIFTTGYSWVKMDKLDRSNLRRIDENEYRFRNPADPAVRYNRVYKGAFFLGVTYNLSN